MSYSGQRDRRGWMSGTLFGCSQDIIVEKRFVCNVTVFQVDLTEIEGARARSDRRGLGNSLSAWPGAFYLRGQGSSI